MNKILCELLGVSKHKRKSDNKDYYSVRVLMDNRVIVMFFHSEDLFNNLSKLERLTDICLLGELKIRDESSFLFVPESFEL